MGWFGSDAHEDVYGGRVHESKLSHELIGGAAAFEAMKAYEDHERSEGKPANHALAKELLAGFAATQVDRLFETKGLDYLDREKAKRHARQEAEQVYSERYEN